VPAPPRAACSDRGQDQDAHLQAAARIVTARRAWRHVIGRIA
jgi:hypothetical protein